MVDSRAGSLDLFFYHWRQAMCLIFSTLHSSTYEAKIRPHPRNILAKKKPTGVGDLIKDLQYLLLLYQIR